MNSTIYFQGLFLVAASFRFKSLVLGQWFVHFYSLLVQALMKNHSMLCYFLHPRLSKKPIGITGYLKTFKLLALNWNYLVCRHVEMCEWIPKTLFLLIRSTKVNDYLFFYFYHSSWNHMRPWFQFISFFYYFLGDLYFCQSSNSKNKGLSNKRKVIVWFFWFMSTFLGLDKECKNFFCLFFKFYLFISK